MAEQSLCSDADFCNKQEIENKKKHRHCGFCGKRTIRSRQLFCSRKCQYASGNFGRKPIPRKPCINCGKTCTDLGKKYCSASCREAYRVAKKAASIRPCRFCGKPCKSKINVLCSKRCMGLEKSHGWTNVSCGNCGKVFQKKAYKIKLYKEHACSPECLKVVASRRAKEELSDKYAEALKRKEIESAKKIRKKKIEALEQKSRTDWFMQVCSAANELTATKRDRKGWKQKASVASQTLKGRLVLADKSETDLVKIATPWELVLSRERRRAIGKMAYNYSSEWSKKVQTIPRNLRQRICRKSWKSKD